MLGELQRCRVCGGSDIRPFFDLGEQPLANSLPENPDQQEQCYPLALSWCPQCSLVQLNYTVDPKELFSSYVWVTGTSQTARDFAERFSEELIKRVSGGTDSYVLEIASNDGTFLQPFLKKGFKVLGIDPAKNIVEMAEKSGVPTECLFWGDKTARDVVEKHGKAAVIFARNVLPHVANTRDFVQGIGAALRDDGVLAIEAHYGKVILDELHYDSIYHEHLCYFTLKSLEKLLNDFGLFVFDVVRSPISGGSLVVYAKKRRVEERSSVAVYREQEEKDQANTLESWIRFRDRAIRHRAKLLEILDFFKQGGDTVVVGYGASARSSTLLNFCGINSTKLPVIADMNPLKQGRYTAGTHIPIRNVEEVMARNPKCIFILAWNFADEIMKSIGEKFNFTGEYLVPLPRDPRRIRVEQS